MKPALNAHEDGRNLGTQLVVKLQTPEILNLSTLFSLFIITVLDTLHYGYINKTLVNAMTSVSLQLTNSSLTVNKWSSDHCLR